MPFLWTISLRTAAHSVRRCYPVGVGVISLALAAMALTGCGIGVTGTSNEHSVGSALAGKALGGIQPIIGATVKIYATGTDYGVGTFLQEANQRGASVGQDTDSNGAFQFAGGYDCPAGQFVYIVSSGGNTGSNNINDSAVMVAALGRCEDLYTDSSGTYTGYIGNPIDVDELTTIAAAYALGNFASTSGTGAATIVGIGAPATNNAAQISGVSTGTTTAAAGLAHAFLNAANLVNVYSFPAYAYANLPNNSTAVVPQEVLNSIGNVLVACVNSDGTAAACSSIFASTTLNSVVPTNTFQAMINLAANPTFSGSPASVLDFLGYATAQTSVYGPALVTTTVVPNDLSIAINYPAGLGASGSGTTLAQGLAYPSSGALDVNDNYYVGNSSASGTAPVNILSFSSNGSLLGATVNSNVSGNPLNSTSWKSALGLSIDANSPANIYVWNGSGSGSHQGILFTATSGAVSSSSAKTITLPSSELPFASAVDQHNNVWVLAEVSNALALYKGTAGATASASYTSYGNPGGVFPSSHAMTLSVDPDQNIWAACLQTLTVLQNTAASLSATPTYTSGGFVTSTALTGNPAGGIAFTGTNSDYTGYVSFYSSTTPGIEPVSVSLTGPEVTAVTPGTLFNTNVSGILFSEADGAGNIWNADTNGKRVSQYNPTAGTAYIFKPCVGGNTACTSVFGTLGKPQTVSVDSTGSIWIADTTGGNVVEIIGAAAPTWPLLALGKTGKP